MEHFHVQQSLPICIALASIGGILEVAATAVTAIPAVREKQGMKVSQFWRWMAVAANVALQTISGFFSALFATWYGPVSIVVPFFYSSTLLSNMVIFGLFLGEEFNKPMQVGTHVIVLAVILLPVVGPTISPEQNFDILTKHWYSILWFLILFGTTLATGAILIFHASPDSTKVNNPFMQRYSPIQRRNILLLCRAASISIDLTVSRCLVLGPPNTFTLIMLIATKLVSGNLYTYAIVVQSYAVEQVQFVPLNATMVIAVNAFTGILIWEDQPQSWYGYICVFWLLGIGCDLLLSVPLLNAENPEFGTNKNASFLLQSNSSTTGGGGGSNKKTIGGCYQEIPNVQDEEIAPQTSIENNGLTVITKKLSYMDDEAGDDDDDDGDGDSIVGLVSPPSQRPRTRSTSYLSLTSSVSRKEAWIDVISPTRRFRTRSYDDYHTQMNHLWTPQSTTPQWTPQSTTPSPHEWAALTPVGEISSANNTPTRRNNDATEVERNTGTQQTAWKTPR
jgi:uncharacterized membrane protein